MPEPKSQPPSQPQRPTTYWDYIRVEDLLALQTGVDGDEAKLSDDEVRFVIVHQIDELWFKVVLRELAAARDLFARVPVPENALAGAVASLRRTSVVFELAGSHFRLMETMRTQDYLTFRDKLGSASGFQSAQLREIEILLGLAEVERIPLGGGGGGDGDWLAALKGPGGAPTPASVRVQRRLADRPTLKGAVDAWLHRTPIQGTAPGDPRDAANVDAYVAEYLAGHERQCAAALDHAGARTGSKVEEERLRARNHAQLEGARRHLLAEDVEPKDRAFRKRLRAAILFIDSNRALPLLSWPGQVIDALIEAEQSMLVFRQRHARMVERVIGRRVGTGGSDGVAYLDQTALRYRVFTEIWAARTLLLPPDLCPAVHDPAWYGLRHE